jgi:virulence-associated protein VagC
MSNIQIQLDPVALREATTQAIMGVLTPEVRAEIIRKAISALLTPSTESWNKNKSPVELAFEQAVVQLARDEAKRMIAEDEPTRLKVQQLLRSTADKVLSADMDKLADRMATAFTESMRKD